MPSDQSPTQIRPSTTAKVEQSMGLPPPRQTDPIACPRCDSTNTKFCYYNNYNLSQPRHFCKTCRRYWTLGGTLRNVPVGGGYRKNNAKRSRSSNSSSSGSPSSSSLTQEVTSVAVPVNPAVPTNSISPLAATTLETASDHDQIMDLIENVEGIGGFTSLLNCQAPAAAPPPLFLALSGYGYGSGPTHGFDEVGNFGYGGGGVWAFPEVGDLPASVNANNSNKNVASSASNGCNTWQMVTGSESGLGDGDCFAWPELEISSTSTGGKVFK